MFAQLIDVNKAYTVRRNDALLKELEQAADVWGYGPPVVWDTLEGGRTNRVYLGQFSSGKLVFKLFDPDRANTLFPNDIDGEQRALLTLAETGLAPTLQGRIETECGPCLAYAFVEGEVGNQTSAHTIKALAQLHARTPPTGLRCVPQDPRVILEQGLTFLDRDGSDRAAQLRDQMPQAPNLPTRPMQFLHGDPTPANTVNTANGGVTFVDWQCPAIGDPAHDLAIALSPAMHVIYGSTPLRQTACENLLLAYGDAEVADRYQTLEPLFRWRMACYCQWKAQAGETEYVAAGLAELS